MDPHRKIYALVALENPVDGCSTGKSQNSLHEHTSNPTYEGQNCSIMSSP